MTSEEACASFCMYVCVCGYACSCSVARSVEVKELSFMHGIHVIDLFSHRNDDKFRK